MNTLLLFLTHTNVQWHLYALLYTSAQEFRDGGEAQPRSLILRYIYLIQQTLLSIYYVLPETER